MKRILMIAACLSLAACGAQAPIQSASTVAAKGVTAANDLYVSASRAGEDLVKLGVLDKAAYQIADAKAYAVLIDVRAGRATFEQLSAATAALTGAK